MTALQIGVLAFHGDVIEHITALEKASQKLKFNIKIVPVRTKKSLANLNGLIIPGGESTTLYKLCERENMIEAIQNIKAIFGTCAGAILLAKLSLMDITVDRNAYGSQIDSFSEKINTQFGEIEAVFIRAPKILKVGKDVNILAKQENEILACEINPDSKYYLASSFHPELTTTLFHEHFLKQTALLNPSWQN